MSWGPRGQVGWLTQAAPHPPQILDPRGHHQGGPLGPVHQGPQVLRAGRPFLQNLQREGSSETCGFKLWPPDWAEESLVAIGALPHHQAPGLAQWLGGTQGQPGKLTAQPCWGGRSGQQTTQVPLGQDAAGCPRAGPWGSPGSGSCQDAHGGSEGLHLLPFAPSSLQSSLSPASLSAPLLAGLVLSLLGTLN